MAAPDVCATSLGLWQMLKDFVAALEKSEDVRTLRADVEEFAVSHEMCGFEGPAALSALSA